MTTYTIECGGFTGTALPSVSAVQAWLDEKKVRYGLKGEEVRVYRFVNGVRTGNPDLVGRVS